MEEDSDPPESAKTSAEESKSMNVPEQKKKPLKSHILKKMDEGQVGRLIRYKSGKTKLVLGETYFDLDMGMETGFLQVCMWYSAILINVCNMLMLP